MTLGQALLELRHEIKDAEIHPSVASRRELPHDVK